MCRGASSSWHPAWLQACEAITTHFDKLQPSTLRSIPAPDGKALGEKRDGAVQDSEQGCLMVFRLLQARHRGGLGLTNNYETNATPFAALFGRCGQDESPLFD